MLQSQGKFEAGESILREALQIGPDPVARKRLDEIISQRTKLDDLNLQLNRADRLDKADALLRQMLVLRPRNAYLHRALGSLLAATGRPEPAEARAASPPNCAGTFWICATCSFNAAVRAVISFCCSVIVADCSSSWRCGVRNSLK